MLESKKLERRPSSSWYSRLKPL
jgi:hypothetical protein